MADKSPVKDKNYNLVTVLQKSLEWTWQMETYASDAEEAGDDDLAKWFREIQENSQNAGQSGKKLLRDRLQDEED